ncbi:MAG: DUF1801 domain-containing protein [Rhizobiaceae bacterium]
MSQNKTIPSDVPVLDYIESLDNQTRKDDARLLLEAMADWTGMQPRLWGASIVGFGEYHYTYESGREGDHMLTGFAPRKSAMTIYIMPGFKPYGEQLARLGPHKHSSSCLYITRLTRVDLSVLEEIVRDSVERMKAKYPWKS